MMVRCSFLSPRSTITFSQRLFSTKKAKIPLCWLDLRGSGLSTLERLCLEEILLRHDDVDSPNRLWSIVGTHEPTTHRWLQVLSSVPSYVQTCETPNPSCIIVMGLGGKPKELLNIPSVKQDGVQVIKRFSGGGTVVLDHNSLWTTIIGRTNLLPSVEAFPRPIMQYTADAIFRPAFERLSQQATSKDANKNSRRQSTLVVDSKSCSFTENLGRVVQIDRSAASPHHRQQQSPLPPPDFALRENDYVLGQHKMGGNAQSITKEGWLHHTSFLWDWQDAHMDYLTLPSKRPEYRQDRNHEDFLVKLNQYYESPKVFFETFKEVCEDEYELETVNLRQVMGMVNEKFGGLQAWFDTKSRNKFVDL